MHLALKVQTNRLYWLSVEGQQRDHLRYPWSWWLQMLNRKRCHPLMNAFTTIYSVWGWGINSALSVCKDIDSATIGTILKEPNRNSITMIVRPNFCPGALLSRWLHGRPGVCYYWPHTTGECDKHACWCRRPLVLYHWCYDGQWDGWKWDGWFGKCNIIIFRSLQWGEYN